MTLLKHNTVNFLLVTVMALNAPQDMLKYPVFNVIFFWRENKMRRILNNQWYISHSHHVNPLIGWYLLCFRRFFPLGKKKSIRVIKKKLYKIHFNFKLHIFYIESKEIKCTFRKGLLFALFSLYMWKQYRLDLLGLGNAPLSSKSLSLDLDSPSTL